MSISPRYTSRDLECLPDIDGVRYEIIDGELFVARQPHWHHQQACTQVGTELTIWNRRTRAGSVAVAPGLIFSPEDNVAPDVVWASRERLARDLDDAGHLTTAPELVIEVLSPGTINEQRDRETKLKLYSRRGVREYWIMDWRARTVQVFRRQDAVLVLVATLGDGDEISLPLLSGFSCAVVDLWGEI